MWFLIYFITLRRKFTRNLKEVVVIFLSVALFFCFLTRKSETTDILKKIFQANFNIIANFHDDNTLLTIVCIYIKFTYLSISCHQGMSLQSSFLTFHDKYCIDSLASCIDVVVFVCYKTPYELNYSNQTNSAENCITTYYSERHTWKILFVETIANDGMNERRCQTNWKIVDRVSGENFIQIICILTRCVDGQMRKTLFFVVVAVLHEQRKRKTNKKCVRFDWISYQAFIWWPKRYDSRYLKNEIDLLGFLFARGNFKSFNFCDAFLHLN